MIATVLDHSFLRFTMAFSYDHHTHALQNLAARVAPPGGTAGRDVALVWEPSPFPAESVIAHVGRFLNPPDEEQLPTARMWCLTDGSLRSPKGLGGQFEWSLVTPREPRAIAVRSVDLALFAFGVGFLTIELMPKDKSLVAWLDTLHSFRLAYGQHRVGLQMRRRAGHDAWEPYWPPCAGGLDAAPGGSGTVGAIIDGILGTLAPPSGVKWWEQIFVPKLLLPFACLSVDSASDRRDEDLLYRVHGFHHDQQEIHPIPGWERDSRSLLPFAERHWLVFSLEGGAFVGFDPPNSPFFRETLPQHVRREYFLLFLLAQFQRFALIGLSERVAKAWQPSRQHSPAERLQVFSGIQNDMLGFMARGFFSQVMQRENHHRAFRRWQEVLELQRLYEEVRDEVAAMHAEAQIASARAEHSATRSVERFIRTFGLAVGVPSLMFYFLSMNASGIRETLEGVPFLTLLLMAFGGVGIGLAASAVLSRTGRSD